jgi:hypothetical protein
LHACEIAPHSFIDAANLVVSYFDKLIQVPLRVPPLGIAGALVERSANRFRHRGRREDDQGSGAYSFHGREPR